MAYSPTSGKVMMIAGLAICLLQVWLPEWYMTGDGPCHLYNAQIVHDAWAHEHTDIYSRFYTIAYSPDPNWLSTFLLALLLFAVKGVMAEKLFLTFYILLYAGGFHLLLRRVSTTRSYWPVTVFLFVFTHALTKGFYNFSFGLAFYLWMVWAWLCFLDDRSVRKGLLFAGFTLLTFFSHLLPFAIGAFTCGALVLSYAVAGDNAVDRKIRLRILLVNAGWLTVLLAPFLVLMVLFTGKEGGMQLRFVHHFYRLVELAQYKHGVSFNHSELIWTTIAGSTVLALFLLCFVERPQKLRVHKYDGFILTLLVAGFVYLFSEEDIIGRAMDMSVRTQLFIMVLMACIISYRLSQTRVRNVGAIVVFSCFVVLSGLRTACQLRAATAERAIMAVGSYIKPGAVLLPLNFSPQGIDAQGKDIADWNFSFRHASQYLGTLQPLIILDNYEANMGYFPVRWKDSVNPYKYMAIEQLPPGADMAGYYEKTGVAVDYVLMHGYEKSFLAQEQFRQVYDKIAANYHIVYGDTGAQTLLWQKNGVIGSVPPLR